MSILRQVGLECNAAICVSALFPKFAAYMKNQDLSTSNEKRVAFEAEIQKLEDYLKSDEAAQGKKFMLGDTLCEVDCATLPKLLQMKAAGKYFKDFDLEKYPHVYNYLNNADDMDVWLNTRACDQDLVDGWAMHGCIKETNY